jgi:hypothetical protein
VKALEKSTTQRARRKTRESLEEEYYTAGTAEGRKEKPWRRCSTRRAQRKGGKALEKMFTQRTRRKGGRGWGSEGIIYNW